MGLLEWLELSTLGTFVRESPSFFGYPTFLFAHTFGLSVVVGVSSVLAARVLGLASGIPLTPLARLFPMMWAGFAINLLSGGGLWLADAVNKTVPGGGNQAPIFFIKMLFVVLGAVLLWMLQQKVSGSDAEIQGQSAEAKKLAAMMLGCWVLAMIAGRLIGYTSAILG